MTRAVLASIWLIAATAQAAIVDRIAITAGNSVIKDSDIAEDLRMTAFLNREAAPTGLAARKKAASQLIEQALIRTEIQSGEYPAAPVDEAQTLIEDVKKRYGGEAAYKQALARYGIEEEDLKARLLWQLTVLRFIDARFRPAAFINEDEIENYFNKHRAQLEASHRGKPTTLDALRGEIENTLAGERVNQMLDDWLSRRRKDTRITYLEAVLK